MVFADATLHLVTTTALGILTVIIFEWIKIDGTCTYIYIYRHHQKLICVVTNEHVSSFLGV